MAGNVRVKINEAGRKALLKSEPVRADLDRRAKAIAAAAGDGFEGDAIVVANRSRGGVVAVTQHARRAEAKDRRLTRAIGAGK